MAKSSRGGKYSAVKDNQIRAIDGADFAHYLNSPDRQKENKKELTWLRKWLMDDLRYYKEHGEVRDEDLTYHIIYKNGEFKSFNSFESDAEIRSIKSTGIAYISLQSGDGINDSLGFNTDPFNNSSKIARISTKIANDPEQIDNYQSEVERIFNTPWGRKHPRKKK